MKFFHSTLCKSQKILKCLPIPANSERSAELILIFSDCLKIITFDKSDEFKIKEICPLDLPIVQCFLFQNNIGIVFSDSTLKIIEITSPFRCVFSVKLCQKVIPSIAPLSHVAGKDNILLSGFRENGIFLSINDDDDIDLQKIDLPRNYLILSVTHTYDPNVFAFLVVNHDHNKSIVLFNVNYRIEIGSIETSQDTIAILTCNDANNKIVLISYSYISLLHGNKISISSRIIAYGTLNNFLIFQDEKGEVYLFNPENEQIIQCGILPMVSSFNQLEDNIMFCVSDYGNNFFMEFPSDSLSSHSSVPIPHIIKSINLKPRMTYALYYNRYLYTATGSGPLSQLIKCSYSVNFDIEIINEATRYCKEYVSYIRNMNKFTVNDKIRIFSYKLKDSKMKYSNFLFSTKRYSTSIHNDSNISTNPTLLFNTFSGGLCQIHKKGIKNLDSHSEWSAQNLEIITGFLSPNNAIVALNDSSIVILNSKFLEYFNEKLDSKFGNINEIALIEGKKGSSKENIIVVATSLPNDRAAILFFKGQLSNCIQSIFLTSRIVSLVVIEETKTLFASTLGGQILSWSLADINIDLNKVSSLFFAHETPSNLFKIGDKLLIANDRIYLYDGNQAIPIQIDFPLSIFVNSNSSFIALMPNQTIIEIHLKQNDFYLFPISEFDIPASVRMIKNINFGSTQKIYGFGRDSSKSFIFSLENDDKILIYNMHDILSSNQFLLSNYESLISMIELSNKSMIILGISIVDNFSRSGTLLVVERNEESEYKIIKIIPTKNIPYCFNFTNTENEILVGIGKDLFILNIADWKLSSKPCASVPTQVAFIEHVEHSQFYWIGDRTQSILCFRQDKDYSNQMVLNLVSFDPEPKQISSLCMIDEFTAVVGDKFGSITLLKLTDDIINETPWGSWRPPDRGILMSPGRNLVNLATISVGSQAITSLVYINKTIFYTTIFGQIGSLVEISNDNEYIALYNASLSAERICSTRFVFTQTPNYQHSKINVISSKYLDYLPQFSAEEISTLEQSAGTSLSILLGVISRYRPKSF